MNMIAPIVRRSAGLAREEALETKGLVLFTWKSAQFPSIIDEHSGSLATARPQYQSGGFGIVNWIGTEMSIVFIRFRFDALALFALSFPVSYPLRFSPPFLQSQLHRLNSTRYCLPSAGMQRSRPCQLDSPPTPTTTKASLPVPAHHALRLSRRSPGLVQLTRFA